MPDLILYLAAVGCPAREVPCRDLADASRQLCAFRDRNGLGASQFKARCGRVCQDSRHIATVSYNGRLWSPAGESLDLCPVCGVHISITGSTTDGRLIGSCGDAFTKTQWEAA